MILVIFTGSRYADWRIAEKGKVLHGFRTTGINSYIQDEQFINNLLNKNTSLLYNAEKIKKIFFFGAGISSLEKEEKLTNIFCSFFKNAKAKVCNDLQASAISTLGDEKGIVGIIGSGSNAAYFNGKKTIPNNFGLGYILADEASTNWLGQNILRDFITETLPQGIRAKFLEKHSIDRKYILEKIYNSPNPNLFLTSFADFIYENRNDSYISTLVKKGLSIYVKQYLLPLVDSYPDAPIGITGSVAYDYKDWLLEIAHEYHLNIKVVVKEPIQNLIKYYINKN